MAVLLSDSYITLVIGRFIGGIAGGGILVCMPMFVAEIANKELVANRVCVENNYHKSDIG